MTRVLSSIRGRTLAVLLALFVVAAALMAALSYRQVLGETEALFDYQLEQMALSLRDQGEIAPAEAQTFADARLDVVVQIWTVDGRSIYASRPHASLPARALLGPATLVVDGRAWRTFGVATRQRVIQVAQPVDVRQRLAARAAWHSVLPLLAVAPFIALAVAWLATRQLAPLERLARDVGARDARSLAPVPVGGLPDELAPLGDALNALLERLRQALDAQRAFVADAAHELRSPLTALKLQLSLLHRAEGAADADAARDALAAGIERAARLVEQLLALARADPGAPVASTPVDLAAVAREAVAATASFAQARHVTIALDAEPPALVRGDSFALALLARNLVDNAVRYAPASSRVEVSVRGEPASGRRDGVDRKDAAAPAPFAQAAVGDAVRGTVLLRVDDAGPGIPQGERARVFDRFYRRAETSDEGGSGLGLAIVASVARAHAASVELGQAPAGGLRVDVRFAAAPADGGALTPA